MMVMVLVLTLSVAAQAEVYVESFLGGTTAAHLGSASLQLHEPAAGRGSRFSVNTRQCAALLNWGRETGNLVCPWRIFGLQLPELDEILWVLHRRQL